MSNNKPIKSAATSAEEIIEWGKDNKIETCFDRAERLKPCPIGETGACCRVCHMGPCRLVGKNAEEHEACVVLHSRQSLPEIF
jgi:carbon-monoxide dehydrogenase catalytic subunit